MLWLLVGAIDWGIAGTLAGEGASVGALVSGAVSVVTDDQKLAWFTVYVGALFAAFSFGLPTLGLLYAGRVAVAARPLPPFAPGTPPRCRCCLASLPDSGTVRRCEFCGADHIVLDDRYRAQEASLDAVIRSALAEGARSIRAHIESAETLVSWALASVVFSLVALPIVGGVLSAALDPGAGLYWFPAIVGGAAFVAYLSAWRRVRRLPQEDGAPAVRAEMPAGGSPSGGRRP